MDNNLTFRTEIEFKGTFEEFEKVAAVLTDLPIRIRVEFPPDKTAGCWIVSPMEILPIKFINKITENMPRIKVLKGLCGGIRDPHLHFKDEIVMIDRGRFVELVGSVAHEMAGKLAARGEYTEVLNAIRGLGPGIR